MRSTDYRLMEESSSSSSHYFSIFTNYPLLSAVLAFTIAQFIKFFTTWYVYYSYVVSENGLDKDRDFTDNSVCVFCQKVQGKEMGSETACWVWRNAFFTFSNCYSSCYGRWFTRRLWRISFRYGFHSHFHCMAYSVTFLISFDC